MSKIAILLGTLAIILFRLSYSIGLPPLPGTPVWQIAIDNVDSTNTIASKEDNFTITVDFSGTFTALDELLSKMLIVASKADLLSTQIDATELNFNLDLSKVSAIEDNLNLIQLNLESLDTPGTFTALEGLKQTVCSKIELLNQQLSGVQTEITDLTATEIDHATTIAGQLDLLDAEVMSINSILDTLSFDLKLNTACSLLDLLDNCLQAVEGRVDLLNSTIQSGFSGTFTALDLNLAKACTIESLVDAIPMSFFADLSETFSALNELQEKICTIGSKVDDLDMSIMSAESEIDILDSTLDPLISKLCTVESKTDAANTNICFSLFDNAIQVLDQDCSILEELNNNQMLSKSCTIESNLDAITAQLLTQQSKLEIIDNDLQTIASKICATEKNNLAISKLCLIDSKLDIEQNTTLTIESIIDSLDGIESSVDLLNDLGQTIFSKLCIVNLEALTICSKLDALNPELQTVDSKLDVIIPTAESSLDSAITIESRIDNLPLDQLVTNTLISKLCLIENQVCTIESTLDIMGPVIGILNIQAQELIGDFQETWTILQVIEGKLCTAESVLDVASNKLQSVLEEFSGVSTTIEAIDQKATIIDDKVNTYESLVDAIVDIDFSGVFTSLEVIQSKVCLADDLVQTISAGLEDVRDCLGIPIRASDLPLTISTPERYFLAEDIDYAGATDAITISTNDVFIDLNDYALNYIGITASVNGIAIDAAINNIQIANGLISNFTGLNIDVGNGDSNIILSDVTSTSGNSEFGTASNVVIRSCIFDEPPSFALRLATTNAKISECTFLGIQSDISNGGANLTNVFLTNATFKRRPTGGNVIAFTGPGATNFICQRLLVVEGNFGINDNNGGEAIYVLNSNFTNLNVRAMLIRSTESIIMNNTIIGCGQSGITVDANTGSAINSYIAFNACSENGTNIDVSVPTTVLGNFAFNSDAVGDPSNTNYDLTGGSDITRKFVTISTTSSFSDRPTEWHNINMLP